jgi:dTDP-4-dehydrorhamnose reductase
MKQRILITGGSGLLALNWAQAINDRYSVVLGLHKRLIDVWGARTQQIDFKSVDHIVRWIEENSPQLVIHAAGLTSVDLCESDPQLAHHLNVTLAVNVAKACVITGAGLVHISTDHLFSGKDSFVDENQPVAPINVYGRTKAEAEYRVLEVNPKSLVIRTNFYGWGTSYRHSFSDIVINALRAGQNLTLFEDVFYTPILVETLALAVDDLIDVNACGVFNVVGDERISKNGFGLMVAQEFGLEFGDVRTGLFSDQKNLVHRPRDMSLSNQKVCNLLGRRLGNVREHLAILHQQETNGFAQKLRTL